MRVPGFEDILSRGFFPKELPPEFSSKAFASALLPTDAALATSKPATAQLLVHNLARVGAVRRMIGIPNPLMYARLVKGVVQNWSKLYKHIAFTGHFSVSRPSADKRSRAIGPSLSFRSLAEQKARVRARGKYLLVADIAECYRSTYTHAIAWALHGKSIAKAAKRDETLVGNALDKLARNAQDGQTNGIPIGPDTSLVLSEVVLASVDRAILRTMKRLNGIRYYDDYEFTFASKAEAEECLAALSEHAAAFGFHLSPTKTRIVPLPEPLAPPWRAAIRDFDLRVENSRTHRLIPFFDIVFAYKNKDLGSGIIAYAIKRVEREKWSKNHWALLQTLLCQAVNAEPSAVDRFVLLLSRARKSGRELNEEQLAETLAGIVLDHAPARHSSEVAWALRGLIMLNQHLDKRVVKAVVKMDDPITSILLLDARQAHLTPRQSSFDSVEKRVDDSELYGPHWLLAYEARHKGWAGTDISEPFFAGLSAKSVSFYSSMQPGAALPITRIPGPVDYSLF